MRAYDFHPEAESDINAIWDYIAEDSPDAADSRLATLVGTLSALNLELLVRPRSKGSAREVEEMF